METILKFFIFFFFYEKILHSQKAQKAQKAQNANKQLSDFLHLKFFFESKKCFLFLFAYMRFVPVKFSR